MTVTLGEHIERLKDRVLRPAAGILPFDEGDIRIAGVSVRDDPLEALAVRPGGIGLFGRNQQHLREARRTLRVTAQHPPGH